MLVSLIVLLQTFEDEWRHKLNIPTDSELANAGSLVPVSPQNQQFIRALADTYSEMPDILKGRSTTVFRTILPQPGMYIKNDHELLISFLSVDCFSMKTLFK